ncbi:hypothetical protein SISNIDRAFT_476822 [Sistotremastrum niveocremeum HHB9708]|uniref:C4-dicarboxylate transporter/malic acid transport protein n=1 Tax=Sistotremastrum niveocremeum HHB9708 TaxID=1314777 RepID=A0A165A0Q8_9AGAM|nr:hypothetical protein SISNIDRAFT_476822 [Sistotremastrum niveocremeum HHB9708]
MTAPSSNVSRDTSILKPLQPEKVQIYGTHDVDDAVSRTFWKNRVKNFQFLWFAVIMANGIIPTTLSHFIVGSTTLPLRIVALTLWLNNFAWFIFFVCLTIARYIIHPSSWRAAFNHPVLTLYIATFPMGLGTIISGAVPIIHTGFNFGGRSFIYVLWAFWWLDVVISVVITFVALYFMITHFEYEVEKLSSAWIFPFVTMTVASSVGNVVSAPLATYSRSHAWLTIIISLILVIVGFALAWNLISAFFQRMIFYGMPPISQAMQAFFPMGAIAQTGYSLSVLAPNFESQLPFDHGDSTFLRSPATGPTLFAITLAAAFVLWILGAAWIIFALMSIYYAAKTDSIKFGPSWWGLIFPNGVYANFTVQLGNLLDSNVFRILGAIWTCLTIAVWAYIAARTLYSHVREEIGFIRLRLHARKTGHDANRAVKETA